MDLELGAVLATSTVPPYHVSEVIASWRSEDEEKVENGFILKLRNGYYAYLTQLRMKRRDFMSATNELFRDEPTHLYDRARKWEFDKEKLNGTTEVSKQQAKYPSDSGDHYAYPETSGGANPRPSGLGRLLHSR